MTAASSRWLAMLLLMLSLSGCSTVKNTLFPPGVKPDWDQVSLTTTAGSNRDFPVAIDIVLVMDEALARKISTMKAADWFTSRAGLIKANPGDLDIESLELVPGATITLPGKRFSEKRVFLAVIMADYFTAGEHNVRVDTFKGKLSVELGATDFSVSASEK
jgi:type VI secretion system protein